MNIAYLEKVAAALEDIEVSHPIGRIDKINGTQVSVSGLQKFAALGDSIEILGKTSPICGEVICLEDKNIIALLEENPEGLRLNDCVKLNSALRFAPDESWIGRVIDPDGKPLDGQAIVQGSRAVSLHQLPPSAHQRRPMGDRLETSLAVFNTLLPLVRGQRIGLFAGSGVGKSTLIADLARSATADVIVIALIGERGREVRHFIDDVLGPEGMARTVIIAATSDRAPQIRKRCALSAMAVAEFFRDQGKHVMLFADSVTRFCEAHREVAVAAGESASLRGFPPSMASAVASLCERAGPGTKTQGDITAVFSVLVAGSDMEEPVADILRGTLDGHIVLDRDIAERGRFPAIDVLQSVSRSLPRAAERHENALISQSRKSISDYKKVELMLQAGLYEDGTDPATDDAIACHTALESFLTINDRRGRQLHFQALGKIFAATNGP